MSRLLSRYSKKVTIWLLVVISIISQCSMVARADSTDRVKAFIQLAQGKSAIDIDPDGLTLSAGDLRFLGVYVSNFFVPFGTELGTNSGESSQKTIDGIKKSLQTNLGFTDDLASSLTEQVLGLSRSSANANELKLYVGDKPDSIIEVRGMPNNYYTFLSCMLGGYNSLLDSLKESKNLADVSVFSGYNYGYFCYTNSEGKPVPVFDFSLKGKLTASNAVFLKCLESAGAENGHGFSFFDFTTEEGSSLDTIKSLADQSAEIVASMTMLGDKVKVDCFGNIIVTGGNHQYIAVPGAMNPYTWVSVYSDGTDVNSYGGDSIIMASIQNLLLDNSTMGKKLFSGNGDRVLIDEEGVVSQGNHTTGNSSGVLVDRPVTDKVVVGNHAKSIYLDDFYNSIFTPSGVTFLRVYKGNSSSLFDDSKVNIFSNNISGIVDNAFKGFTKIYSLNKNGFIGFFSTSVAKTSQIDLKGVSKNNAPGGSITVKGNLVFIDNLGVYEKLADYSAINFLDYFSSDSNTQKITSSLSSVTNNGFSSTYQSIVAGELNIPSVSESTIATLYATYVIAGLYDSSSVKETIGKLGYRMNINNLPSIPDKVLLLGDVDGQSAEDAVKEKMQKDITGWVYYILHPTKGFSYMTKLIKNTVNNLLVEWHNDMVGTNGTGSINGTTKYRGYSGYVTTPELTDIPWTSTLLSLYNNSIPFILIAVILIMLGAYISGILTLQKAIIGFVVFAICFSIPSPAINTMVAMSNRFSSSLYGDKFMYWALVQHESYSDAIDEAASGDSYSNYLQTIYAENSKTKANQGSESIMLKWQAPKKMSSLVFNKDNAGDNLVSNSIFADKILNNSFSGENYVDDSSAVYLYRSYIDIANFSRYIHQGVTNKIKSSNMNINSTVTGTWYESLKNALNNYDNKYTSDRVLGYANVNSDGTNNGNNSSVLRVRLPLSSKIVSDAYGKLGTVKDLTINDYVGIDQRAFNFSIPMFTKSTVGFENLDTSGFNHTSFVSGSTYTDEDYTGLAAYGLMSENPFYYFSWNLYESGLSHDTTSGGYKSLLLGSNNGGYFYNANGNGELKDFMDFRSLFTYVIPYLKQGNDLVKEWDSIYGLEIYEGVPTEEGYLENLKENPSDSSETKAKKQELRQKYWHNLNVARLYNIYTPWVDIMYDCSYAKAEKIQYMGESYVVTDPLNPSSYPSERPMIFSKSEMVDYGLKESQLTAVEKKILKCQEEMQERMFSLLNYYTFNDVVLNTAAAMSCAFAFNNEFSQNNIIGVTYNIYPQTFELSDFSYDAFLRFILSNSTGESMLVGNGDFYYNITENSSTTTILFALVLDIIAMYVIPGLKMFFIVGVFILGVLMILVSSFGVNTGKKFYTKLLVDFFGPIVKFGLVSCGMAWVVSLFMGSGSSQVTGVESASIALGDPVMAIIAMIVLNVIVIIAYVKILLGVFRNLKKHARATMDFIGTVAGSMGTMAVGALGVGGLAGAIAGTAGGKALSAGASGATSVANKGYRGLKNKIKGTKGSKGGSSNGSDFTYIETKKDEQSGKSFTVRLTGKPAKKAYNKNIKNADKNAKSINNIIKSGAQKLGKNRRKVKKELKKNDSYDPKSFNKNVQKGNIYVIEKGNKGGKFDKKGKK